MAVTQIINAANVLIPSFIKADSSNLPPIDCLTLHDFFSTDHRYVSNEGRNEKMQRAMSESYGDSAVGYVQLQRDANICTVYGRVTPEHMVSKPPYRVYCVVDESRLEIVDAYCLDCKASEGGCKHAVAFVYWIHRRNEDKSVTEVKCYWAKSALSSVMTKKYMEAREFSRPTRHSSSIDHSNDDQSDDSFLKKVIDLAIEKKSRCHLFKCFVTQKESTVESLELYALLMQIYDPSEEEENPLMAEDFISHCQETMEIEACKRAMEETVNQSSHPVWLKLKHGRVTASNFHQVSRCKTDGSLDQLQI